MLRPKYYESTEEHKKRRKENNKKYREKLKYYGYRQILMYVPDEMRAQIKNVVYTMIEKYEAKKKSLCEK